MSNLNKVLLIGRLGADPELRYTVDGTAVASFNIATTETTKSKSGEKSERTEWHRVVAWRKLAEIAGEYLKKGKLVYIEGKLQSRDWEKDGVKRKTFEIVASQLLMLGGNNTQPGEGKKPSGSRQAEDDFIHELDDDVPM